MPADDDWILNANYIDKTFLRHVVSYELFRDMNSNNRAAKTAFVQLNLNDWYNGLYVLMEKVDRSILGLNKADSTAVLFKDPPLFRIDFRNFQPQSIDNFYQQLFPNVKRHNKAKTVEEIAGFLINSSGDLFAEEVQQLFDIENIIDWHLLLLMSNNGDGILKNFYLYKIDRETPFRISPWDYDESFGRYGNGELNMLKPVEMEKSTLFFRLLSRSWYKKQLRERCIHLNNTKLLSVDALKARITAKADLI